MPYCSNYGQVGVSEKSKLDPLGWDLDDYPHVVEVYNHPLQDHMAVIKWLRECPTYMRLVNDSPWNFHLVYQRCYQYESTQWCFRDPTMAMLFKLRWGTGRK